MDINIDAGLEARLIRAIISVHTRKKYTVYQCKTCGYGQGHQIVFCPKCGGKIEYLMNISSKDLGRINQESRDWNEQELQDKIRRRVGKTNFILLSRDYHAILMKALGWEE